MQLIGKCNKGIPFLCVVNVFNKNTCLVSVKDTKNNKTITKALQKILDELSCNPSQISADKDDEFYMQLLKSLLQGNNIDIYSTNNQGKSVVLKNSLKL